MDGSVRAEDAPNENPVDADATAGEPKPPKVEGLAGDDARAAKPPPLELPLAALELKEEPKAGADPDPKAGALPEPKAGIDPPEPKAGALPEPKTGAADPPPKMDAAAGAEAGAGVLEAGSEENENGFFGAARDIGGKALDDDAGLALALLVSVVLLVPPKGVGDCVDVDVAAELAGAVAPVFAAGFSSPSTSPQLSMTTLVSPVGFPALSLTVVSTMASTYSIPSVTQPNTTCFPSRCGVRRSVMKN